MDNQMYIIDPSEHQKPLQLANFNHRGTTTYPLPFHTKNELHQLGQQCFYQPNTYVGCISHHGKAKTYDNTAKIL